MVLPTSKCFAGRIIVRQDGLDGLDWATPCPVPTETTLATKPPMYFCVRHGESAVQVIYRAFEAAGLMDYSVVADPEDEFEELMQRLGPLEGQ